MTTASPIRSICVIDDYPELADSLIMALHLLADASG
jgi:hypothetical protein